MNLWARRDSNPLPSASEGELLDHQAFGDFPKDAESFGSTMTSVSSPYAANAAKSRDFATPLLQESESDGSVVSRRKRSTPRYLTVREAAAVLRVCTATVYKLCERGELPHLRVSNAIRVLASDLATTISRRRRQ